MTDSEGPARGEHPPGRRLAVIAVGGSFFLAGMPWLLAWFGGRVDRHLALPLIGYRDLSLALGALLIAIGLFFGIWSVSRLFSLGKGTPLPLMPTHKLVVRPPYTFCRNPMALGLILFYLGCGVALGSVGAIALAALFALGLLIYIRASEERELKARFGEDYREYKRRTPFLIPKFPER